MATVLLLLSTAILAQAQTSAFTYQGRLSDGGTPANGTYDLQFKLFDSLAGSTQIGSTQTVSNVSVSAGIFTVSLDFGPTAFPGANRWLDISARLTGIPTFTTLSPRQPITSIPYAIRSLNASSADSISSGGTLSANVVNATTQYNQDGDRILAIVGDNFFAGPDAGAQNTSGSSNSFFGWAAGQQNKSGSSNSFFGFGAGNDNTLGHINSFFGVGAGSDNTIGQGNTFFGAFAGVANISGSSNSIFGDNAGLFNKTGSRNTLIGSHANLASDNLVNATAIGSGAVVDQNNSLVLGSIAGVGGESTTVNVGIGTTKPLATLDTRGNMLVSGNVGIGTTTPLAPLDIAAIGDGAALLRLSTERPWVFRQAYSGSGSALRLQPITGLKNFEITASGGTNVATFVGDDANPLVGIGTTTPQANLDVNGAGVFRPAGVASTRATSFGSPNGETGMTINGPSNRADVRFDGSTLKLVAGAGVGPPASTNGLAITTVGSVGIGTITPFLNTKLDIVGGFLRLDLLAGGGDEQLCRNSAAHTLATCSSSLRYKEQIAPYRAGLELINRLRPITFSWKANGSRDLGLGAEDVAKVEPLLTFKNDNGETEGVRYDRLNIVLINAIKEQQKQIATLRAENAALNGRLKSVEGYMRKHKRSQRK
jgi:hypothetical protein